MNTTKIRKTVFLVLLLLVIGIGLCRLHMDNRLYSMEVVKVDNGYGYKIYHNEKPYIFQPFIPVVAGKHSFENEKDAEQVGRLVLERLSNGQDFSVTVEDLRELKVAVH